MMSVLNAGFPSSEKGERFKFTQQTDDCQLLKQLMENGEVTPSTKPADIRQSREEFRKIDSDKFRAQFNKLKQITGLHTREGKRTWFENLFLLVGF